MSILNDLFYGNLAPYHKAIRRGSQYEKLNKKLSSHHDYFKSKLSSDDSKKFDELIELYGAVGSLADADSYTIGFRHGVQMIIDVMFGENESFD